MDKTTTDRRSFLKTGSLIAAPLAMAAPAAALADDGSRAKLARLEDERAIEALQRKFLRQLNGTGELVASSNAVDLGEGLRAIAEDLGHEATLELSDDGLTARARCACRVERETEFTGDSTIEQMARFQGQGSHRHEERRTLATEFVKDKDGWTIARATLA
jgi:ParB-like chromosome segregation protein Spo0J